MEQARQTEVRMDHAQFIALKLERMREAHGMSVAELARRAHMGESQLGKVLRGERGLRAEEYLSLCFVLGVGNETFMPKSVVRELAESSMRAPDGRFML